jgi:outer membrane protein
MLIPVRLRRPLGPCVCYLSFLAILLWSASDADFALAENTPSGDTQSSSYSRIIPIPGIPFPCRVDVPMIERPDRKILPLSLQDCVSRTILHSLDIQVTGYEPAISQTDITSAEAVFDAVLFGSATHQVTDQANINSGFFTRTITTPDGNRTLRVATDPFDNQRDSNYLAGLRKKLPTGASIQLAETLRRFHDINNEDALFLDPFYQYSLNLELRQPLLRDFGIDVNRASINAARDQFRISEQNFQRQVIATVAQVETNYWQLVTTRLQIVIFQNQLREGETSLDRLLYRRVLDASSETIARSRGLIERARANLVAAKATALQQQDQLLDSIDDPSLPLDEPWEIIPLDSPTTDVYNFDRRESIKIALSLRPEVAAQRIQVDIRRLALGVAENQVLPRLDMVAQQQITGADNGWNSSWDRQWSNETTNYLLGLSFEVPLGNRAAEAGRTKARHQLNQDQLQLKNFERQVVADVNISITALEGARDEVVSRNKAAEAESDIIKTYQAIEGSEATVDAGFLDRKIESFDRLTAVQQQLASTLYDYNIALMNTHRAQGTLLRHDNIKLAEIPEVSKK